jgi:hypothetical protein
VAVTDVYLRLGYPMARPEVVSGTSTADALGAGPHAAPSNPVLLCAAVDDCGPATLDWLRARRPGTERVIVVGGTAAISDVAADALLAAAG